MSSNSLLVRKIRAVWPLLDERTRRLMAANEAIALGYGGVSVVHRACGLSRKAIDRGIREIEEGDRPSQGHIRRAGGGRKNLTVSDPHLLGALDDLIDSETRGDPESRGAFPCRLSSRSPGEGGSSGLLKAGRPSRPVRRRPGEGGMPTRERSAPISAWS